MSLVFILIYKTFKFLREWRNCFIFSLDSRIIFRMKCEKTWSPLCDGGGVADCASISA